MAGTIEIGSFDDNRVKFEIDYDDNLDVISFKCRNENPDFRAFGTLIKVVNDTATDTQYGLIGEPNQITTIEIPQGGNQGIRLHVGLKPGRLYGYTAEMKFPF